MQLIRGRRVLPKTDPKTYERSHKELREVLGPAMTSKQSVYNKVEDTHSLCTTGVYVLLVEGSEGLTYSVRFSILFLHFERGGL